MATLQTLGTVRLRLRLGGEDYQETLHAVQGDTGRVLEFDVLDGDGTIVTDLTGVTPVLFVRRPDGKEVGSATGEIVGGVIRITIPSSLLAYAGETKAQIQLIDSANQHKLHDHLYRLQIEESLEAGASPGENLWFSLAELTEAIAEVHLLVEQYDTDVAAVAIMRDDVDTKHGQIITMHGELQDVFTSEQERRTAESARISAETDRQTAETARANAESARGTAEGTRKTQETARQQAETQRDTDEDTRIANEVIRQSNEGMRISQEGMRQTNETARVSQYQQAQELLNLLGQDPTVNLTNAVTELQKTAHPRVAYDFLAGHLVKTNIKINYGEMIYIRLFYNAYTENKLREYVGYFYPYLPTESPLNAKLFAIGNSPPLEISILYQADGSVDLWIPSTGINFQTLFMEVFSAQKSGNQIASILNAGEPTDVVRKYVLSSEKSMPIATASVDGLYPKEHFSKVDAIPASPKYTDTVTTINGKTGAIAKSDITALGIPAQDTVYTHPATHPASMITQDSARRMVSDTQIATWSGKLDKSGGQMTGELVAQPDGDTRQARNIAIGTTAPTSTAGYSEGDVFLVVP